MHKKTRLNIIISPSPIKLAREREMRFASLFQEAPTMGRNRLTLLASLSYSGWRPKSLIQPVLSEDCFRAPTGALMLRGRGAKRFAPIVLRRDRLRLLVQSDQSIKFARRILKQSRSPARATRAATLEGRCIFSKHTRIAQSTAIQMSSAFGNINRLSIRPALRSDSWERLLLAPRARRWGNFQTQAGP
jgi:hypothetical protein